MADSFPRSTVCLCLIVKNEAEVLTRCFDSCRDLIDYWVICDTGSTDGTQDLIRRELADIPGELHETEWVDFGTNRSELVRLAHGKADYLLLLDADMTIEQVAPLGTLTAGSYYLRQAAADIVYRNKRLVKGDLEWRYHGSTHEVIKSADDNESFEDLDAIIVHHHADGGSRSDKFERDMALLTKDLSANPGDARAQFYLAQTCGDLGHLTANRHMLANALDHYQRRADMPGWDEETYYAQYQVGVLAAELGDWPRALDAFVRAWELRPQRLEAVHALAAGLRERDHCHTAHRFTRMAANLSPLPVPPDILFVTPWVYEWGMLFEYSITAYWVGEYRNSMAACKRLLTIKSLPEEHRKLATENLKHAARANVRAMAEKPRKARKIIKHTGTPTRGFSSDFVPPAALRDPEFVARLARNAGMAVADVEQHLLRSGKPVVLDIAPLDLSVRVRPGTTDLRELDAACETTGHLPAEGVAEPKLIVDVGAGIGVTTLHLARSYPNARLIAVESDPDAFDVWVENLRGLEDRVTAVEASVGASNVPGNGPGAMLTLDSLLDNAAPRKAVDHLKLDCGSALLDVLRVGGQWPTRVASIKVAVDPQQSKRQTAEELQRLGFEIQPSPDGWVAGTRS